MTCHILAAAVGSCGHRAPPPHTPLSSTRPVRTEPRDRFGCLYPTILLPCQPTTSIAVMLSVKFPSRENPEWIPVDQFESSHSVVCLPSGNAHGARQLCRWVGQSLKFSPCSQPPCLEGQRATLPVDAHCLQRQAHCISFSKLLFLMYQNHSYLSSKCLWIKLIF